MHLDRHFLWVWLALASPAASQLVFTSGSDTNQLLFERVNGQTVPVETGAGTHDFPGLSRGGRFVSFSVPDPVQGNGLNPSSDIYLYDRLLRSTRRVVNHFSDFDGTLQTWNTALSSQLSPNGAFLAYGVAINRAIGATGGQVTNELNIADAATGVILSNPTFARGATSDAFAAEFRGLSFAPDGQSFVTPLYRYTGINDPTPIELPTIVRFSRNAGNGQWELSQILSSPQWQRHPSTFIASASVHTWPALSPSGQGLAYFSVLVPDVSTGSQPWTSRVVVANADGSNPRLLTSFSPGFVPTGLAWTSDGTGLVVSVSSQANLGTGFLPMPQRSNSAVFSVATSDGATSQITALGSAVAPMLPGVAAPPGVDLADVAMTISRASAGSVMLRATGLDPAAVVTLQTSENSLTGFQSAQQVTGAQMAAGLEIPLTTDARFFRLAN